MSKIVVLCLLLAYVADETLGQLSCDDVCKVDKLEMYGPVCGSDGNTYDTKCALTKSVCKSKKAVSIVNYGKCDYSGKECLSKIPCHLDKAQLCASDGKQYYNECAMRRHACQEKKAMVGVKLGTDCTSCPTCKEVSGEQVCGSDHKTYKSLCFLRRAACQQKEAIVVLKKGSCEAKVKEAIDTNVLFEEEEDISPDDVEDEDDDDDQENETKNIFGS